jgi:signal-transduction protein with cAMP-binding, CBS, and nucleotidyltransferase domain
MATAPREVWGDLATTAFVESSHLFKSLDPDARRDLLQVARVVGFSAGEAISGEAAEGFCLVLDGAAAPPGAAEAGRLERGAFFGEALVLGAPGRTALAASGDVTLVVFPAAVIAAISERFPKVRRLLEAVRAARGRDAGQPLPP